MRSEQTNPDLLAQMGYESRDVNVRQIIIAVVALMIFFAFCQLGILLFYAIFIPDWAKLGKIEPLPANRRVPPYPQVQVDPRRDFELYRQAEDKQLSGEIARMSVEQAINVMATEKGIAGMRGDTVRQRGSGFPGQTTSTEFKAGGGEPAGSTKTEDRGAPAAAGEAPAAGEGAR